MSRHKTILLGAVLACAVSLAAEDRPAKKRVAPAYPELAKKMHIGGAVKMEVDVDPEGQVHEIKVIEGHALLRDAAITAVKQWVFTKSPAKSVEVVQVIFHE
jgi:TonB family protein